MSSISTQPRTWAEVKTSHSKGASLPADLRRLRSALRLVQAASPWAAGKAATWLAMHPRRKVARAKHWKQAARAQKFDFTAQKARLQGYRWGSGPPVLLCHGWDSNAATMSHFIDPLLASGHSVIAFDAPAHGASAGTFTTMAGFAAAVMHFVETRGDIAGIIAHSMGAAAATLALSQAQAHRPHLVLIAPPADPSSTLRMFSKVFGLNAAAAQVMATAVDKAVGRPMHQAGLDNLGPLCASSALIIHDADDPIFALAQTRRAAAAFPHCQMVETQGLGHLAILADAEVIRRSVAHATAARA